MPVSWDIYILPRDVGGIDLTYGCAEGALLATKRVQRAMNVKDTWWDLVFHHIKKAIHLCGIMGPF